VAEASGSVGSVQAEQTYDGGDGPCCAGNVATRGGAGRSQVPFWGSVRTW